MKCKECDACTLGYFESRPFSYVCIGTKEPFIVDDINQECTERRLTALKIQEDIEDMETKYKQNPYVDDEGIYVPVNEYVPIGMTSAYRQLIPKEIFVAAYEKWILSTQYKSVKEAPLPADAPKWEMCVDGYYPYCPVCMEEPPSGHMTRYCPNCGTRLGK